MTDERTRGARGAHREMDDRASKLGPSHREAVELLRNQVASELGAARRELTECRVEADRLRDRLGRLEREHHRVCDDYRTLEADVAELGNGSIVVERLHGTLDRAEVLGAIQDVVINVIGSEELAVLEPTEDGRSLAPAQCFGVESRRLGPVAFGEGFIGRAAAERRGWVVGDGPPPGEAQDLTACVPLTVGDRVVGVLAIWRMLGHKPHFGEADRRVLELVRRHAGRALYLASLHAQHERGALRPGGVA